MPRGGWQDRALMLCLAINTGSSFTQVALETWFWLAMPFPPPLLPLPAAPGLVVCRARGCPKTAFWGDAHAEHGNTSGSGRSSSHRQERCRRPHRAMGSAGSVPPQPRPFSSSEDVSGCFKKHFRPPPPPPRLTHMQLAQSNNNRLKNILKTENLCSMTQIELYITAL